MRRRIRLILLFTGLGLCLALGMNAIASRYLATREGLSGRRDAETGVLAGAEGRHLGPVDSRKAVLLVHGHLGDGSNFGDLGERLAAEGWRVRMMRLPGHGTSPMDYEQTTREELKAAVRGEYAALCGRHECVAIVGFSMGGTLATIVASERSPDALVLAAPYFGVTYRRAAVLPPETWHRLVSPWMPYLYKGEYWVQLNNRARIDEVFSYRWAPATSVTTLIETGEEARGADVVSRIDCPVLWLHGADDDAASPARARAVFDAFPSTEKHGVILPRSNHHLFFDYDGKEVVDSIVCFLGEVERSAGTEGDGAITEGTALPLASAGSR